ncbi:Oidioi.mRNA.OKI2018_I69.PAR.g10882.t1.cds [Oikopleura dioica]|uniref:Oidioi.mRNA.OKI2018_I69.PAR.g10882.t1.cds n=1 Tax=Oikopleura dioica TaxID=34765 RepID=A0ABN7RW52_OIKDI|nr:Oidioi.mRNA.OKI2018_I69.PAR.g10882.t1.cds [Oikopleura dioica]
MDKGNRRGRGRAARIQRDDIDVQSLSSQMTDLDVRSEYDAPPRSSGRGRGRGARMTESSTIDTMTSSESASYQKRSSSSGNHTPQDSTSGSRESGKTMKSTDSEGTEKGYLREQKRGMQVLEMVPKNAGGTKGARIQVASNYYKTSIAHQQLKLFEYRFESGYEKDKNEHGKKVSLEESMAFFSEWLKVVEGNSPPGSSSSSSSSSDHTVPPRCYFDGRNKVYSFEYISDGETMVPFRWQKHRGEFAAKLTCTNDLSQIWELSMHRLEKGVAIDPIIMHVKETIIKHKFALGHIKVGSTYYPELTEANYNSIPKFDIAPGKIAWKGLNVTVKNTMGGLSIQAKTKAAVFYKPCHVLDFIADMTQEVHVDREDVWANPRFFNTALTALKGLLINIKSPAGMRTRKVMDISRENAVMLRFKVRHDDGSEYSQNVADYYRNKYGPLRFPKLPCINTAGKNARPEYYPIEFCHIMGRQPVKGKLADREVAAMIKFSSQPAPDTFREIGNAMNEKRALFEQDFKIAGLKVDEKMVRTDARVLDAPELHYGNGTAQIRNGSWNPLCFVKPAQAKRWTAMYMNVQHFNPTNKIWDFSELLRRNAAELGMRDFGHCDHVNSVNPGDIYDYLNWAKGEGYDFVLCVIDKKFSEYYSKIKAYAERTFDLLTQCLVLKNLERANGQLCKMLLAKINAKLGGYSCYVDLKLAVEPESQRLFEVPVMIQALDINKPQMDGVTIATLASSFDENATSFNMVARTTSEPNFATKLEEMESAALVNFYKLTREKPQAIIFFRPGVNEADMAQVMTLEVKAIQNACRELEDDYCPKITYIVASKMHNTRFGSMNPDLQIGKGKNLPAGTVVDTEITSSDKFDFYLQSSMGIQGTSIPTHYYFLYDENKLNADSAQGLCYYLCHGFARCNRTISMPNAMKYAQLASARARNWCKEVPAANPREYEERIDNMLDTKYLIDRNGNKPEKKQKSTLYQSCFFF